MAEVGPGSARPEAHLKAVLFDIGGTLLDFVPEGPPPGRRLLAEGCRRAYDWLRERGKDLPDFEEFARRHWRALWWARLWAWLRGRELRAQQVVLRTLARMGVEVPPEEVYDLTECYYRPFGETLRPVPGAREVLERLSGMGLRLATVSNTAWPGYLLEEDLARFGLTEHLEFCLFSSYFGRPKPAQSIFGQALKMLRVSAAEAMFVGDSLKHDIQGAKRAGMRTVLLRPQASADKVLVTRRRVDRARGDWTIAELAELVAIVEQEASNTEE